MPVKVNRDRKWFNNSKDKRAAQMFDRIAADLAAIGGVEWSEAVTRFVIDSYLGGDGPARVHGERVFCGDVTVMGSVAEVLRLNVAGGAGGVRCAGYRELIEFAFDVTVYKACVLDTSKPAVHHLRERFQDMLDVLEGAAAECGTALDRCSIEEALEYGRALLWQLGEGHGAAVAAPLIKFALDVQDLTGERPCTCAWLADALEVADETCRELEAEGRRLVPPDTPELRRRWIDLLAAHAEEWAALV